MILAAIVDNRMGLSWMGKRLSKDAAFRRRLLELSGGNLRMSPYSAKQFAESVYAGTDYLSGARPGEWCFAENGDYLAWAQEMEKVYLFRWNRDYPADVFFTFPGEWHLARTEDFPGTSHETITMEVYER